MSARVLSFSLACSMLFAQGPQKIADVRQITSGGQNAEAYWSPDGERLVFQSTRDDAQCDQIYVMDADGQNVKRISRGIDATTCCYFLPDGKRALYALTHEGGAACPPRPDRSKGYIWAIPATYEIYVANLDGKIVRKLTNDNRCLILRWSCDEVFRYLLLRT
ncbi:MAG: hypothetical protein WKF37_13190, partial [Bryobacteraceae bacterium]